MILVSVVLVCVIGGGTFFWPARASAGAEQKKAAQKTEKEAAIKELGKSIEAGNALLTEANYAQAAIEFQAGAKIAEGLKDPQRMKIADEGQRYATALAQAKSANGVEEEYRALEEAMRIRQDAKVGSLVFRSEAAKG